MSSIVDKSINRHFYFVNQIESEGWVSNRNNQYSVPQYCHMIINKKITFPRHFSVTLMQSETLTKYWSIFYGFCKRNNGVLYSGIWPRHRVSNWIKSKKRDIKDIPICNCALWGRYGISNRVESNWKVYQLIALIKFHINDITSSLCIGRVRPIKRNCLFTVTVQK